MTTFSNYFFFQKEDDEKRREQQRQYGVFFDDDYDYLQHLKEASAPTELVPSVQPNRQGKIVVTADGEVEEEIQRITVRRNSIVVEIVTL